MSDAFSFTDYKAFLRETLTAGGKRGGVSRLAQAAGCQRSYFSRVLHEHVHLTPDQAFGLAQGLGLSPEEREYFVLLVDRARAGSAALIAHLETRLAEIRRGRENLSLRLKRETRGELGGDELAYYSSWVWPAVHLLTSVPECRTEGAIARRLGLPPERVRAVLGELERLGFVRREGGLWSYASGSFHIPKGSPLVSLHHNNWRQRAILDAQDPSADSIHYTMVQTMSRKAFEEIKQKMLQMIEDTAAIGQSAREEELVVVACDLFRA